MTGGVVTGGVVTGGEVTGGEVTGGEVTGGDDGVQLTTISAVALAPVWVMVATLR